MNLIPSGKTKFEFFLMSTFKGKRPAGSVWYLVTAWQFAAATLCFNCISPKNLRVCVTREYISLRSSDHKLCNHLENLAVFLIFKAALGKPFLKTFVPYFLVIVKVKFEYQSKLSTALSLPLSVTQLSKKRTINQHRNTDLMGQQIVSCFDHDAVCISSWGCLKVTHACM